MKHAQRILAALLATVMLLSLLPATAFAAAEPRAGVTIDVTDYGADPTGAKESSTAVIAALEYAKTLGENVQKTIYFPKGEYHFYADYSEVRQLYVSNTVGTNQTYKNKHLGILVEDMKNVTIDGGGSQFIYHGDITAFASIRSENVTFTNFDMDHASPSVVDVTVESKVEGENAVIVYVPPCYTYEIRNGRTIHWMGERGPVTGAPYWEGDNDLSGWGQMFDMLTGTTTRAGGIVSGGPLFSNVASITELDDNRLKVTYNNANNLPNIGYCYQLRWTTRTTPGAFFWESENVTMEDMDVHFLHGFGVVAQLCKTVTVDGVSFAARPGTGRTTAGFADFLQMSSVGGKVTIKNCDFSNPHDDPINIHGTFLTVDSVSADHKTFTLKYQHSETAGFPQYYVGDQVDFATKGTMIPVEDSLRTVTAVQNPAEDAAADSALRTITITLDRPVEGITGGNNGFVVENVTYTPEVLVENCRFAETPTRGVLVTTRKPVVIQNNYFDRMGMAAIFISCDAQSWYESGHTEDVTIRGNTFIVEPRFRGDALADAGILIGPTNPSDDPNHQIHSNLLIEDNTFYMARDVYAIYAKSVKTLTVKDNQFLRCDPNITMALSADDQSVAMGGSQATSLQSSGTAYTNKLFYLHACKDVTFEHNTYDDGLNRGAGLASITTAADVTVVGDDLAVGGDKRVDAVASVRYFSSDPSVAVVDEAGVVTGVSAGRAEIYAYTVAGGRVFESNHLTFTVTGTATAAVNKIDVTGGSTVDVGGTINLSAAVDPTGSGSAAWSVRPATEGAEAAITESGVLTGAAPGVVEVTATLGGVSGSKLVTVNHPGFVYLSDLNWTSATVGDSAHSEPCKDSSWTSDEMAVTDENDDKVVFAKGIGTHANSDITYNLGGSYTRFTAKVGASYAARVKRETNIRFQVLCDSTERYTSGNTAMSETTPYKEVDLDITGVNTLLLKVSGVTNTWSAHGNWADAKLYTNNQAPTAASVTAAEGTDTVDLTYTYSDADHDAEADSLIAWYVSDTENGHYTRLESAGDSLPVTAAVSEKWVRAVVVPRDATGRYGAPVTSNAVQAPQQSGTQDDATLASLSVAGAVLSPAFDPNTTNYTVDVPPSADSVTISASASQTAATVAGTGEVAITGTQTVANVTVTAPNGLDTKTYTVTIRRAAKSNAELSSLTAAAGSAHITYASSTRFYRLEASEGASTLALTAAAADPNATIAVRFNGEEKGEYSSPMNLPLVAGLNHLELRVTAEDGISTALYRVVVVKPASNNANLASLQVNGENALGGEGLVRLDGNTAAISAAAADPKATVRISVDGRPVENGGSVTLTGTTANVNVWVIAEDTVTEKTYSVVLAKNNPASAELAILKLGGLTLDPAFDPGTENYTATSYGNASAALDAIATQSDAVITYETVAEYGTGEGRVTPTCRFFGDAGLVNKVIVTVASPDGQHTKTYTITVDVVDSVYLSDLNWLSGAAGDTSWNSGIPMKDLSWESGKVEGDIRPIKLIGTNGEELVFEKGIGTHANSTIVYDLSEMGFTTFSAKVGVSYYQKGSANPHLIFRVSCDGEEKFQSSTMATPAYTGDANKAYQEVNFAVDGTKQLELAVTQTTNIHNAHGNWADAKLSSTIPLLANTEVFISDIKLQHDSHTIYTNEGADHTVNLHPVIKPSGVDQSAHQKVISWTSADPRVATVNDGVVTAVDVGATTITATALSGAEAQCEITVKQRIVGQAAVSGETKFGSELTADINDIAEAAKSTLTYQWFRGETAEGTVLSTEKTYTPVLADINSKLTVKVTAHDPYEGSSTFTTAVIGKADGPAMQATPTHRNVSAAGEKDGAITGLFKGREYQYLEWDFADGQPGEDAGWKDFSDMSGDETGLGGTYGTAEITGLGEGKYVVRRAGDAAHNPGPISNTVQIVVRTPEMHDLTNPHNFDGGVVQARRTQIPEGDTVTLLVIPDEGYELVKGSLKAVDGNRREYPAAETATAGTYTFIMPEADVTISASFAKKTYTISHELENITCSMAEHNHTVTHGDRFTITLTPADGYEMPRALTVTGADGTAFTDYTYTADPTDSAKRVLTFAHGVTQDITVKGEAVRKQYTVVYSLTNGLTAPDAPQSVIHHGALSVTLSAARGYELPDSIAVTVDGVDFDEFSYDPETGAVEIAAGLIDGNVVITAQGETMGVALQSVAIIGPARVGRTLAVNTVPVLATVSYQWILVDEDGTETPVDGATEGRFVIPEEAEGKTIKVRVTGIGGYSGTMTSDPTATVLPEAEPFVFVDSITLDPIEASVAVDKTVRIGAAVEPANATSGVLYWFSSNDAIATVDQNGVVTGVAEGTVTITARSTDTVNFVSAECTVTVTPKQVTPPQVGPGGGWITPPSSTTTVTENPDGSTTTTVTDNRTGTVTETTEKPDGATEVVETKKDGTVTSTVTDPEGGKVEKVTTPEKDVSITVTDPEGETLAKVEIPAVIPEPDEKFVDVPEGHWAEDAIYQAAGLKLVEGVGNGMFELDVNMKRGDLAHILFRMSNGNEGYDVTFEDVPAGKYYANSVAWAAATGVVTGYSETAFGPENTITREQLAVMLYRYANLLKLDTDSASAGELDAFTDGASTSDWAMDGMAWCVKNGIIQGMGNDTLAPGINTTRAEVVTMLQRFMELMK